MRTLKRSLLTTAGFIACCATAFALPANAASPATAVSSAAANDSVDFSLHLPLQNVDELDGLIENQSTSQSPLFHHFLTPAQFRARYGPDPARVRALVGALNTAGLQAAQTSTQVISVRGSAANVERLLSTKLVRVTNKTGRTRVAALAAYALPNLLAQSGAVAMNLHASPPFRPLGRHIRAGRNGIPQNRVSTEGPYAASDLKEAYQFPSYKTTSGAGISVAFIAGGDFSDADLATYLKDERVGSLSGDLAPAPKTHHFYLPGAVGFDPNSGDSQEANLDSQQIALTAPGVSLTGIIVPDDSDGSFFEAYVEVVELNKWDIVSLSYGNCELDYLPGYNNGVDYSDVLKAQNDLYKQGNAQGITFVTASADEGAFTCPEAGYFNNPPTSPPTTYNSVLSVNGLASMPNTVSVGGGVLTTSSVSGRRSGYAHERGTVGAVVPDGDPYGTGNLVREVFAAGGGISALFPRPKYQQLVKTGSMMRTVPDVGGNMGSITYDGADYEYIGGVLFVAIGTSASAPDFAGLLALKASVQNSRLGLENPDIYELSSINGKLGYYFFHQSNAGDDGNYAYTEAHQGYNYIYGVGSPHGANFAFLPFSPLAGDPKTPSNP
jgi:subtilase family serine protease